MEVLWYYGQESKQAPETNALILGQKGKAPKQKNKQGAKAKKLKIKHTLDNIALFSQCKVKTPLTL